MNGKTETPNCLGDYRFTELDDTAPKPELVQLARVCNNCPIFTECGNEIPNDREHFVIRAGVIGRAYRKKRTRAVILDVQDADTVD